MLSKEEKKFLLDLARRSIKDYLDRNITKCSKVLASYGVFVTLTLKGELRGCIGFIQPVPLCEGVIEASKAAAFQDTRFPPLTEKELKEVKIEISVLSTPKKINVSQIEIGKHGLIIDGKGRSGLLLPQVPIEHGMNKEEFLEALCQKAGLPSGSWKKEGVIIKGFEAHIFKES